MINYLRDPKLMLMKTIKKVISDNHYHWHNNYLKIRQNEAESKPSKMLYKVR